MSEEVESSGKQRNVDDRERPADDFAESGSNDVAKARRPSIEERLAGKMFTYSKEISCLFVAAVLTFAFAFHSA